MKTKKKNLIQTLAHDAACDVAALRDFIYQSPAMKQNQQYLSTLFTGIECRIASINYQIVKGVEI